MYFHIEPVSGIAVSILEPIASQVVRYIISKLGLEKTFGNKIIFNTPIEASTKTTDDDNNITLTDNRIICNVNNILAPEGVPFENTTGYDITSENYHLRRIENQFPIFSDIINKVYLYSMDRPGAMAIDCSFQFADSMQAYEVSNRIFTQVSNGMSIPVTDIMFEYGINESILVTMFELYKLTNFYKDPRNNFVSYLKEGSKNLITILKNRYIKEHYQLVIQRTLRHCMIRVEFGDQGPNADKRGKAPIKFNNQMTLTVQYSQPSNLVLEFPLIVNNQLVPIELIPEHGIPDQPPVVVYPEISVNNFMKYVGAVPYNWLLQFWDEEYLKTLDPALWPDTLKTGWVLKDHTNIVRVPPHDNWVPNKRPNTPGNQDYNPIIVINIQIDEATGEARLHLYNDIQPATGVATSVIDYIRDNPEKIFFPGLKYMINVFRDDRLLDVSQTKIEGDWLIIKSNKFHAIHRVVIYVNMGELKDNRNTPMEILLFDIQALKELPKTKE